MFGLVEPMRPPTDEHSYLAGAFLALADDPEPPPSQRSGPRVVCAFAAGIVIALAAPLAWASPSPGDQPTATAAGKAGALLGDDDDDAGGAA
jgi:hypothetical protein